MKRMPLLIPSSANLTLLMVSCAFLTGCVAPQVRVQQQIAQLDGYAKVYFIPIADDPRAVNERVRMRLEKAGFETIQVDLDGPGIDVQGSGFVISPQGHVLTCAHVVGDQTNASLWIDGKRHVSRVIATDTNLDAAILQIEASDTAFTPLPFASETNYAMGQDVFTMGFPLANLLGTAPRLNKGLISSTVGMEDDPKQLQVSAEVQPGNSGGPLLNQRGEVVGLVTATLNPMRIMMQAGNLPQNVNFAAKLGPIREMLREAKITPAAAAEPAGDDVFERAGRSLALVRPGIVTDEELKQPSLLCVYSYASLWDMFFRFRYFEIAFFDTRKGDWVLKAGQYRDDPFVSEDGCLDRTFAEICEQFFPQRPNPFRKVRGSVQSTRKSNAETPRKASGPGESSR